MSFKFSKKSLAKLDTEKVHPLLKQLMFEAIKTSPIDFTILETVRNLEQQRINIKKGVSKTIKSKHIPSNNPSRLCEAIDVAPYPIDWANIERFNCLATHIKETAKRLNIELIWGGDWKTLKDYPHYELKL